MVKQKKTGKKWRERNRLLGGTTVMEGGYEMEGREEMD